MAVIKIGKGTNWKKDIQKAFDDFKNKEMETKIFASLDQWCQKLIRYAVEERLHSVGGHNFTGNLINSIVIILYSKGTQKKVVYYSSSISGKPAIMRELSALNARGKRRKYKLRFGPGSKLAATDWSNQWSTLKADMLIATDRSYGFMDAVNFANSWRPITGKDFEVCVAYTSEYAKFVEAERHTTGFLETMSFAEYTALNWVGLK